MPATREVEVFRERERERESPPRNRWDRDRFDFYRTQPQAREREIDIRLTESRSPPVGPPLVNVPSRESDRRTVVEERDRTIDRDHGRFVEHDHERFVERDRYGPSPGRRYWEEPTPSEVARGALAPYRKVVEYEVPSRPRMIRRQSSLDTFDRRPMRYEREEWRPPSYVPYALPYRPGPRYDPYYEEMRYRERDLSPGWEEEYRDVRVRRKGRGHRHRSKRRERSVSVSSSSSSSSSEDTKSVTTVKTSKTSTTGVVLIGKKGKTRMPKRLVHKQAIIDIGLPYEEEEHFIIVQRALEKEHIDDVIKRSEGYRDTKVTYKYEEINTGNREEEKIEEKIETRSIHGSSPSHAPTIIATPPPPPPFLEIPPPPASIAPSHRSHHTHHSSHRSRSRANSMRERDDFYERRTEIIESDRVERKSDRAIRDEIRALEAERDALRLERRADRRLIEAERRDDREEVVFVEKDRRGRMALVAKKV